MNLFGHDGDWPARREVLRAGLARLRPDVVALQALAVVRRIEELFAAKAAHVVVGGDFNATPDTSSMWFWTGRRSLDGTRAGAGASTSSRGAPHDRWLRVLTVNLLAPAKGDYQRRRPVLAEGLRRLRPDVVALQETVWGDGTDQAVDAVGACLASRWPLGTVREVSLQVTGRTASMVWAAALVAEILAPPPLGPLLFVHHKPNRQYGYERERELQTVTTARYVEELVAERDLQVVLAGDFDDPPDSASIRFWTGRQSLEGTSVCYEDAWEVAHPGEAGHTFSPRNPLVTAGEMALERGRRIDYVMVRCGVHGPRLDVAGCELAFDQPVGGVWASDHFGVVADLTLPPRPPGSWA